MLFLFFFRLLTRSKTYLAAVGLLYLFLLFGAYGNFGTENARLVSV